MCLRWCVSHTHTRARPSSPITVTLLLQATSLTTLLIFLTANWIFIFDGIEEYYYDFNRDRANPLNVLGFNKLNGIVAVMISLVFSVLLLFMIGAVIAARRVAKIPKIRLVSTKQPPELSIVMGLTWHLFNSHIW